MRDLNPHALRRGATGLVAGLVVMAGCVHRAPEPPPLDPVPAPLQLLTIAGPAASPDAEISALCWCGDRLVMLPQHPERLAGASGTQAVFVLDRAEIEAAIADPAATTLVPRPMLLEAPGLPELFPGWDGIEAAVAVGDTVYMAIEARTDGRMTGYLLRAQVTRSREQMCLVIDTERVVPIPVPTDIPNMSQEALILAHGQIGVLFEANGVNVNPGPHVALFDRDLTYRSTVPLEHVEYRITDACQPRDDGTFWVINYFFPGESRVLDPPVPPVHPVEHLLELRFDGDRVVRSGRPPLDLRQDTSLPARNWEAMVRLDDRGFLLMTDRYPTTLLAFVPFPGDNP